MSIDWHAFSWAAGVVFVTRFVLWPFAVGFREGYLEAMAEDD